MVNTLVCTVPNEVSLCSDCRYYLKVSTWSEETHFLADQLADPARVVRRAEAPLEFEQDAFVGDAERVPFDFGIAGARTAWTVRLLAHGLQHAVHHKGDHLAGAAFPEHTVHDAIDDDLGTLNGSLEGEERFICNV